MSYLDYNATAPLRPEALARMQELLQGPLNPSSVHRYGRDAKKHLEDARALIAGHIGAWPNEIVFTSSGTEANITALRGFPERRLLVSAVEHSSVLKARADAVSIPVTSDGIVDLGALAALLAGQPSALVSVMLANNETGVIQPLHEISELCKQHGALLHCDAVQALGKIVVEFSALGVDMMTLSAHKCGGPLGVATLVVRNNLPLPSLLIGGGQELGRRAGTENVAAIAAFAVAVDIGVNLAPMQQLRQWLDVMEDSMEVFGGTVFGKQAARLPNTSCVAMPNVSNEVQLMDFDLKGFAVSAGSACSSGRVESSYVLAAMGVAPELARSAIRISAGWQTTQKDIMQFSTAWAHTCTRLKQKSG